MVLLLLTACSGDGAARQEPVGGSSARAVVDAHIAASRRYDLAAACNLLSPSRRAEMAAFDGAGVDGYCEIATRDIEAAADTETKARTRSIYTDPVVSELAQPLGRWFQIEAADGSYTETIEVTEIDGRWWVARIESDIDEAGDAGS